VCQAFTGSAFNTGVSVLPADFVLLTGNPKTYVRTTESGKKVLQAFCDNCGSPIYRHSVDNPSSYRIGLGTIKQRAMFTPARQIWKSSALPWIDTISEIPVFDQNPP